MGNEGPRPGPAPQDEPVCGGCGRPVGTAIRRRKVLGVFVPEWGPGPCRNDQCALYVTEDAERAAGARRSRSRHVRRRLAAGGDERKRRSDEGG
ncbi:hypothetical protein [Streptomyces sp. NPDC052114]|uniref:hypothetical protein n=1 Tax=unclassified Streptomyces TaxID=2593676 RepID=UPI003442D4A2